MSTAYNNQQPRLGFRSRLWRGLRSIITRRRFPTQASSRYPSQRLALEEEHSKSPTVQIGASAPTTTTSIVATSTAVQMPSTTLQADDGKINPSEWFPVYQGCVEHFMNVAQHRPLAQSLAAYVNIRLPYQRAAAGTALQIAESATDSRSMTTQQRASFRSGPGMISLVPYIRRLVVTATDTPAVMQELFGDDWYKGVGTIQSQERVNYLFSAKSGGWLKTKSQYDILPDETVPFLRPLRDPQEDELRAAEAHWSQWLAMEDWMVGPRSPFEDLPGN